MKLKTLALMLFAVAVLMAQSYTAGGTPHAYYISVVPTSAANVVVGTVYLKGVTLVNTSTTTADTVTLTDRGGDCSGACAFLSAVSVAASTTYVVAFNDDVAPSGLRWSSANGTTVGRVHYVTTLNLR